MPVTLMCPRLTCRKVLRVPDNVRGKRVRCAECGLAFLVPATPSHSGVADRKKLPVPTTPKLPATENGSRGS